MTFYLLLTLWNSDKYMKRGKDDLWLYQSKQPKTVGRASGI